MTLAAEIENARRREQIAALDRNDANISELATRALGGPDPARPNEAVKPFIEWANRLGVRYCPARPTSVAAYVLQANSDGVSDLRLLEILAGIERLHDAYM